MFNFEVASFQMPGDLALLHREILLKLESFVKAFNSFPQKKKKTVLNSLFCAISLNEKKYKDTKETQETKLNQGPS